MGETTMHWQSSLREHGWRHQLEAIEMLHCYQTSKDPGAALVSMPTGTGKTLVVAAVAAEAIERGGRVLIVTPWATLAEQLVDDLTVSAWEPLGISRPDGMAVGKVRSAAHLTSRSREKSGRTNVHVATFAMLQHAWRLCERDAAKMRSAFADFSLAIVDECQYEPASEWSRAIRATGLRACLLTATPFRNDRRALRIDPQFTYLYSHLQAEQDDVIRKPVFIEIDGGADIASYVANMLASANNNGMTDDDRAIVRCANAQAIRLITNELRRRGERAVGLHDTFGRGESGLLVKAPRRAERTEYRYFVHQNKLTEGFDEPSVRVVAIRDQHGTDRSLIQQIGRALRRPRQLTSADDSSASALILVPSHSRVEKIWSGYLEFNETQTKQTTTWMGFVDQVSSPGRISMYSDGRFRRPFDPASSQAWRRLRFARNVTVWESDTDIERLWVEGLADDVLEEWAASGDRVFPISPIPGFLASLVMRVSSRSSPHLASDVFLEFRLEFTLLVAHGRRLFVQETGGGVPECIRRNQQLRPLTAAETRSLISGDTAVRSIRLQNSDVSPLSLQNRSLRAQDLALIAPEIGESGYSIRTAEAHIFGKSGSTRRYIGIGRSRIHDQGRGDATFQELHAWILDVANQLDNPAGTSQVLNRYAEPTPCPAGSNAVAAHALLHVPSHLFASTTGASPVFDVAGGQVGSNGDFRVSIHGAESLLNIRWRASQGGVKWWVHQLMPGVGG